MSQPIETGSDTPSADAQDSHAARIGRRWPTLAALTVMWIALWGDLSLANLLGGAVVAIAVMTFADRVQPRPTQHFNAVAALRYAATFVRQLLVASWQVAQAVVRPEEVKPGILAMPLYGSSDAVVTLVANSITLTPGTLTLETERRGDIAILYVHALDLSDADGVREDICQLEVLAVEAFAGPDAQAVQARTLADLEERGGADAVDVSAADGDAADAATADGDAADAATADGDAADVSAADGDAADAATVDRDAANAVTDGDTAAGDGDTDVDEGSGRR